VKFFEAVDVVVDSKNRVFVFSRGEHPLMVFDRDGTFFFSWGEKLFTRFTVFQKAGQD
jgi:hypothetical protein